MAYVPQSQSSKWFDPSLLAVGGIIALVGTFAVKLISGALSGRRR